MLGLTGYVASMGCWYLALRRMALSRAYALLSLSYILVWGAAVVLPGWGEHFSARAGGRWPDYSRRADDLYAADVLG